MAKVLCIEPNTHFSGLLRILLEKRGIPTIVAESLEDAKHILNTVGDITLITISYELEDASYKDVCRYIREQSRYETSPVYLITSNSDADTVREAFEHGATDVLPKKHLEAAVDSISKSCSKLEKMLEGNVLLLEDSTAQGNYLKSLMESRGLRVSHFTHSEDAFEAFSQESFDVIITDLLLEGDDTGISFIRKVRNSNIDNIPDIPIIVTTGYHNRSRQLEIYNLDADAYIVKPVRSNELIPQVSHFLQKQHLIKELKHREKLLEQLAIYDSVSGLYNRNGIIDLSKNLLASLDRQDRALTAMVIDLDGFKNINDQYGHLKGDEVLSQVSKAIKDNIHECDIAGRWGGDEFVVLLDHCDATQAKVVARRLNYAIATSNTLNVTASIGFAQFIKKAHRGFDDLFSACDKALYLAKENGKNCNYGLTNNSNVSSF